MYSDTTFTVYAFPMYALSLIQDILIYHQLLLNSISYKLNLFKQPQTYFSKIFSHFKFYFQQLQLPLKCFKYIPDLNSFYFQNYLSNNCKSFSMSIFSFVLYFFNKNSIKTYILNHYNLDCQSLCLGYLIEILDFKSIILANYKI